MTDTCAPRFFFCHLQKTGGTTLIRRLRRHFGPNAVYPNRSDGDIVPCVISVAHLAARWRERGREIRLVTGHFPLCTQELLGGGFRTFTVLREPVARTLSFLRHHRRESPADRTKPLEEIYDETFRFNGLIHNHMVKMLSLTAEEMTAGALTPVVFTRDHLVRAKANLAAVDVVGVQERLEDFCSDLQERFAFRLGAPVFLNRSDPAIVTPAFRERIAHDNALDVELYAAAVDLVAARRHTRVAS